MLKKRKFRNIYDPINLFLKAYNYDALFKSEELSDTRKTDEKPTDLLRMPPIEGDKKVKGRN